MMALQSLKLNRGKQLLTTQIYTQYYDVSGCLRLLELKKKARVVSETLLERVGGCLLNCVRYTEHRCVYDFHAILLMNWKANVINMQTLLYVITHKA